jgi:hypothetical protein
MVHGLPSSHITQKAALRNIASAETRCSRQAGITLPAVNEPVRRGVLVIKKDDISRNRKITKLARKVEKRHEASAWSLRLHY